jgi:PAS domain S-box-containing protein
LPTAISGRLPGEQGSSTRVRALRWLIGLAVAIPSLIIAAIAITSWKAAWLQAENELRRSADAFGEYVLRILDGHRIAADRVNDLLQYHSNEQIQANEEQLHRQLARLLPSLPLVQTIAVLRPDGLMLLTANVYPVPRDTYFDDREWVQDLKKTDAPATHISRVNVGRLDRNLFFGVSRRRLMLERPRNGPAYDGVINISVQPNQVAAGFTDFVSESEDVVTVVRSDGEILVRNPGFQSPMPPLRAETSPEFFAHARANARRGLYTTTFRTDGVKRLVAYRRIEGFPVYSSVARTHASIVWKWWWSFLPHLAIGVPATALLAAIGLFAMRRAEEVERSEANARFHAVFDASPVGMAVLDAERHAVIAANAALGSLIGLPAGQLEKEGKDFRTHLPADAAAKLTKASAATAPTETADAIETDLFGAGTARPVRLTLSALPGVPPRNVVVVQDITEIREADARRDLMLREVEHRSKNTLAVVQAALRLGASGTTDVRELAKAVEARVAALARSQSLLTTVGEGGAPLHLIVEQEVAPFAGGPALSRASAGKLQSTGRSMPKAGT